MMERGKFIVAVVKNSFFLIIYMKQKEINSICLFMSFTALIFVLCLYFKSSREGLENEEKNLMKKKQMKKFQMKLKWGKIGNSNQQCHPPML
jgi:hypothetical protein